MLEFQQQQKKYMNISKLPFFHQKKISRQNSSNMSLNLENSIKFQYCLDIYK